MAKEEHIIISGVFVVIGCAIFMAGYPAISAFVMGVGHVFHMPK